MLLDKKFEQFLKEDPDSNVNTMQGAPKVGPMDSPSGNSADDVDVSIANIHRQNVLDRINGYLNAVTAKPYINPYTPINQIRNKLMIAGLQFEEPYFVGESGIIEKKLVQFGGRFGWDPFVGDVVSDDGLSHKIPGGLKIVFRWIKQSGLYSIDARIMKGDESPSPLGEARQKMPDARDTQPSHGAIFTGGKHPITVPMTAIKKTPVRGDIPKHVVPMYTGPKGKLFTIPEGTSDIVEVTEEIVDEANKRGVKTKHGKRESNIFKVTHDNKDRLFTFAADVPVSQVRTRIKHALGHSNFSLGAPKKKVVYEGFDLEEMIVNEVSPPGMEKWTGNPEVKAHFKAQYGDRWKQVMYSTAWKRHNEECENAPHIPDVEGEKPVDFGTKQHGEPRPTLAGY
jgi:hypothetical protein